MLSNFAPTHDTSSDRVAGQFDNFPGLRNYRAEENGAEWIIKKEQAMMRIPRDALDRDYQLLPDNEVFCGYGRRNWRTWITAARWKGRLSSYRILPTRREASNPESRTNSA